MSISNAQILTKSVACFPNPILSDCTLRFESQFNFESFDEQLYMELQSIVWGQSYLINLLKKPGHTKHYLPWSYFEKKEMGIQFGGDLYININRWEDVWNNTGSIQEIYQGKIHLYHLFAWLDQIWEEGIDLSILEKEVIYCLNTPIS